MTSWPQPDKKEDRADRLQKLKSEYPSARKPKNESFVLVSGSPSSELKKAGRKSKDGPENGAG
jgi:hypothetical protein